MFRFTIRDVLWLTVMVALAVSWWVDNKRIEQTVGKLAADRRQLEVDRRLLQADFDDRLTVLDEAQRKLRDKGWRPGYVQALSERQQPTNTKRP